MANQAALKNMIPFKHDMLKKWDYFLFGFYIYFTISNQVMY